VTDDEVLKYEVPWDLEKDEFQGFVRDMIKTCVDHGKVISLPIELVQGEYFLDQMAMLLSQVDCKDCHKCCISEKGGVIDLQKAEYELFCQKYGKQHFVTDGKLFSIPYPCPFLQKDKCSIYGDRPFACVLYPFQPGGYGGEHGEIYVIAVASSCPEGRRIARGTYMTSWRLRKQFNRAAGKKLGSVKHESESNNPL